MFGRDEEMVFIFHLYFQSRGCVTMVWGPRMWSGAWPAFFNLSLKICISLHSGTLLSAVLFSTLKYVHFGGFWYRPLAKDRSMVSCSNVEAMKCDAIQCVVSLVPNL